MASAILHAPTVWPMEYHSVLYYCIFERRS